DVVCTVSAIIRWRRPWAAHRPFSRHDRLEARDVHDLRRDEGRCAAQGLRHRMIAETVQTTSMMRDFEFISRRSLADRLAAWTAAAMVVLTTSQFAAG